MIEHGFEDSEHFLSVIEICSEPVDVERDVDDWNSGQYMHVLLKEGAG